MDLETSKALGSDLLVGFCYAYKDGRCQTKDGVPVVTGVQIGTRFSSGITVAMSEIPKLIEFLQAALPQEQVGGPVPNDAEVGAFARMLGWGKKGKANG